MNISGCREKHLMKLSCRYGATTWAEKVVEVSHYPMPLVGYTKSWNCTEPAVRLSLEFSGSFRKICKKKTSSTTKFRFFCVLAPSSSLISVGAPLCRFLFYVKAGIECCGSIWMSSGSFFCILVIYGYLLNFLPYPVLTI